MRLQGVQPSPISYDKNGKSVLEPTTLDTSNTIDTRWSLWVLGTGLFAKSGALDSLPNYDSTRGVSCRRRLFLERSLHYRCFWRL